MRFVFFGSADFGLPSFARLVAQGHHPVGVVTTPDRPKGRGLHLQPSEVAQWATQQGIGPVLKPEKLDTADFEHDLKRLKADLFVVIAYRILPERIFTIPPLGTVNVHASLLPRYRGPAPIQRAIEQGETRTGVSVFRIDRGIDTGGVLVQRATDIGETETGPELYVRLSGLGAEALAQAVDGLVAGTLAPVVQDATLTCRAPKLRKEEALVDWTLPAAAILRRIRAFKPFPGTHTMLDGRRLGVVQAVSAGKSQGRVPGTVLTVDSEGIVVAAGDRAIRLIRVKPEGKGEMGAGAFARGARIQEGAVLR
jgi:methionyl-tRNA formyltransferase